MLRTSPFLAMFGLFNKPADVYDEMLAYLVDDWRMKDGFARAFLDAYRKDIAHTYARGKKHFDALASSGDPQTRLMGFVAEGDHHSMTLITQAYRAYMDDLRRGKFVGTDTERVIWAILVNRSDLLEEFDRPLAHFISEHHEKRFPALMDEVFSLE